MKRTALPSHAVTPNSSHSPIQTNNLSVHTLRHSLSVLEQEFTALRESPSSSSPKQMSRDYSTAMREKHTQLLQHRELIKELHQAMRELEEDNQHLRNALHTLREEVAILKTTQPT